MARVRCPSPADLEELFLGAAPEEQVLALEQHLLECNSCLETLKTLLGARENLAALLRARPHADPFSDSPVVAELLHRLQSWRSSPAPDSRSTPSPLSRFEATLNTRAPDSGEDAGGIDFLSPPQAGDELGRLGKYRILKVLGRGGMGVVFLAEDPLLNRPVAVKAMLPGMAGSASAGKRFLREARAMAAVKHDHIVTIYQVDEERSVPFLAMECLEGEPLEERIEREKTLPVSEVLRIGREIAEGLAAAHERGLIHRDVKPANIWLEGKRGRVKILDFGLARAAAQEAGLTQQGAIIGTPAYMAPEQARGDPVDARSDLFSLGVMLYRLCSGRQPFQNNDTVATLMAVATHQPPPLRQTNPDLPAGLSRLVMQMLEKDPDRRPSSAAEVVKTLQALEMNQVPPGGGVPTGRRRRPVLIAAVLLLAGLLGLGTPALIRITTDRGDYVINTDDPDFTFQVTKGTVTLRDARTRRTYHVKVHHQTGGEYELEVADGDADLVFHARTFTIRRGREAVLKTWFERKPASEKQPPIPAVWFTEVARLPAEQQGKAVADKLKERNKGFDGLATSRIEGGVVTEYRLLTDHVTDLTPLQALPELRRLECPASEDRKGPLATLLPLKDMKLTELDCSNTQVSDLSPLKDMKLTFVDCAGTNVSDLSPLKGMPLAVLYLGGSQVADLSPLKEMKLKDLHCQWTRTADLSPLKGMPLTNLICHDTRVSDLSPLKGVPLTSLFVGGTQVSDLSPLKDLKLTTLHCQNTRTADLLPLKGMKLTDLNISRTQVSDLSPLKDMKLTHLVCFDTQVGTLLPLKDMKLTYLNFSRTQVIDLTPLKDMKLTGLWCDGAQVSDLSPLKDMKLKVLWCQGTQVTDLSPLKGMPLEEIFCDFKPERDAAILRALKTLEKINGQPAREFWKEVDARQP